MEAADTLLRKVWARLEKACKQENVNRYQIEARTPVTPPKVKPPTEFQKAKEKVIELLARLEEQEEVRKAAKMREKIQKVEETRRIEEEERERHTMWSSSWKQLGRLPWDCHDRSHRDLMYREVVHEVDKISEEETEDTLDNKKVAETAEGDLERKHGVEVDDGEATQSQFGARKRTPLWEPPEGMRRCGQGCSGCGKKCVEQGVEYCQGCHKNKIEESRTGSKVTTNSCFNRLPCVNPQLKLERKSRSSNKDHSVSKRRVGSQSVVSRPGMVKEIGGVLEDGMCKREREEEGNTPEKEKQKIKAQKTAIKATESKIAKPTVKVGAGAGGTKPPAAKL